MKLQRIRTELPPARLRVTLPGDLKATLDTYASYYREQYGEAVGLEALIPQILTTFVDSDRAFRVWQQTHPQPAAPLLSQRSAQTPRAKESKQPESGPHKPGAVANGEPAHVVSD